jgi:hypothetical protein
LWSIHGVICVQLELQLDLKLEEGLLFDSSTCKLGLIYKDTME